MDKFKKLLKHKYLLPIVILVVLVLAVITVFLNSQVKEPPKNTEVMTSPVPTTALSPLAASVLTLSPNPVTLDANGTGMINVDLDSKTNNVTAVQLELQYDPKALTNVALQSSTFFAHPVQLLKRINTKTGRITFMLGISPAQQPVQGKGTVATITFSKVSNTKLHDTTVSFSHINSAGSIVAASGIDKSVLKETHDTTILLNP